MRYAILACLAVISCGPDETIAAYSDGPYQLIELDGVPFTASATLDVSTPGRISGQAPCNSYFAAQSAPYPWFDVAVIGASRRACPDLPAEAAYFDALRAMEFAETLGATLILSNSAGRQMVFQALP